MMKIKSSTVCFGVVVILSLYAAIIYMRLKTNEIVSSPRKLVLSPYCYQKPNDNNQSSTMLSDFAGIIPRRGKSIFFLETSCILNKNGLQEIRPRAACSVEAAARVNPDLDIYLLYTSPAIKNDTASQTLLKTLLSLPNVKLRYLNYKIFTKRTPVEHFFKYSAMQYSRYPSQHASEILRHVLLWKYGGIYLDLDVMALKPFMDLPDTNYAGIPHDFKPTCAVIKIAPTDNGREIAEFCLNALTRPFKRYDPLHNGGGVLLKVLNFTCSRRSVTEVLKKTCSNLTLYPPEIFHPIPWWLNYMFYNKLYNKKIMDVTENSYTVHFWDYAASDLKVTKSSKSPYIKLAKKNCPLVYEETDVF